MRYRRLKQGGGWQAVLGERRWPCAVGRSGVCTPDAKREGDGASPEGCWPLRKIYYRADRVAPPSEHFPCIAIEKHDGWCDDAAHPLYNQLVRLPFPGPAMRRCGASTILRDRRGAE